MAYFPIKFKRVIPGGAVVKNPEMQETWVQSLGWEDPLEKVMATHSKVLAWRIPWTGEPGRLQSMGSQSQTRLSIHTTHKSQKAQALVNLGGQRVRGIYSFWLCSPLSLAKEEGAVVNWRFQEGKGYFLLGQRHPYKADSLGKRLDTAEGFFVCLFFARGISRPVLRLVGNDRGWGE